MSDETDATGERRRRWRLGSVRALPLAVPSAPNSNWKLAVKSAIWPATDTFPATPSPWATLRLLRGIQSAPTVGDVAPRRTSSNSSHDVGGGHSRIVACNSRHKALARPLVSETRLPRFHRPGGAVYREIESRSWEMGSGPPGDIRTRTHVAALRRAAGKLIDEGTTFTSGLS